MSYEAWDGTSPTFPRLDRILEPHIDYMTRRVAEASSELAFQSGFLSNLIFGLRLHGAVDLDGTNEYDFATLDAGVYTLISDVLASSLYIRQGIVLLRANLQVHVNGPYVCDGVDDNGGRDADHDQGMPGPGYGADVVFYSVADASPNGTTGADGQQGFYAGSAGLGGNCGVGGGSASHAGGPSSSSQSLKPFPQSFPGIVNSTLFIGPNVGYLTGGAYGASGAGEDGQSGAGGGAAGILFTAARSIDGKGILRSRGGKGGDAAAASNSGGGAGAGGGALILIGQLADSLTLDVAAGQGGLGDGTGSPGTSGTAGRILRF